MNSHDERAWNHPVVTSRTTHPAALAATRTIRARRPGLQSLVRCTLPLVAALWVCGSVSPAVGQEARTLVSNIGQPTASGSTPVLSIQSVAMQFSTGSSPSPWTLTSIRLDVGAWQSGATPTVSLHAASGQSPGARIATLTNPAVGSGPQAFSAPSDSTVTLQASTTYTVVIQSDTTFQNYNGFTLRNTESAAEDSGGATGWQIGDDRLSNSGNGWSASGGSQRLRMAVRGTGGTVSDDATLSTLALADGSSNAVALTPTFAAGTRSYTAEVAWSVSAVTVTAAATHGNATMSIAHDDDTTTPGTAELDLDEGANTVTVSVTAEDTTTTSTYTVTVTRAAVPAHVPRSLVGNTGQPSAAGTAPVLPIQSLAMQFTTGSSANRWTLTAIQLEVTAWQSAVAPTVSLHAASGQTPGTRIATLTNPAPGTGSKQFTVPSNADVKLQANTTYTVVIESASLVLNGFALSRTGSTAEDSGGAPGWRIADTGLSDVGQGWITGTHRLKLAVLGTADSDAATLSALTLADGDGNAIDLDPAFAAGTTGYTASVTHSVDTITVTATATDTSATVSIANDDDATAGTAELDLVAGANTVTVTVTAQDAVTTGTYTVTVTRAAAAPAPDPMQAPQTLVSNVGQPQHASVEVHKERRRVGIKFTTGDSTTGWTLAAIRLHVTAWHSSVTPTVKLRRMSGRWPGTTIATLTNPSPGTGSKAFTAPSGLKLQPNTTYGAVVAAGVRRGRFNLGITKSNHEDSDGAAGWSIADASGSHASGSWSSFPQSLMVAVQGAATSGDSTPNGLTGWFASTPAEHDGSGTFTVRIGFSDAVRMSRSAMKDHAVQVSGGRVTTAKRVQGSGDLWDVKIAPAGLEAITVTAEGGRECGSTGAICTGDGRALAATLARTIPGPPALAVADAEAREGTDPAVVFTVTLSRGSSGQVTVDYATADGTARAGEDYTATSGTLTFAAGVVEQSVNVPVLDDVRDEGEEHFTFTLSSAAGASLGDAEATGTIVNSDPMPKAWITRFGRTVAAQTVDAIGERLVHDGGSRIVIGGVALDGVANVPKVEEGQEALRYDSVEDAERGPHAARVRSMSPRELLLASEFQLDSGDGDNAPAWTAWGRVASSGFEASQDGVEMDGDVTTGILGVDVSRDRWLAGLAVSLSQGDGSFAHIATGTADDKGRIEGRLESVYPYARHRLTERFDVWGLVGYGTGELTITEHAGGNRTRDVVTETDLSMRMGAMGTHGKLLSAAESGGLELAVKADAFWVRMESEAVASQDSGRMEASTGDASRLRLVVQGWQAFELAADSTFTPSAQLGVRHDGGDAETGTGLEVGAGARIGGRRFSIEGAVRALVAHEEDDYEEWGAGGSIRIEPGDSGRGLSFALGPAWGAASSGVERLWSLSSARGLARDDDFDTGRRLEAEVGYGLGLGGPRDVLTPYAGLSLPSDGNRVYRTGARWTLGPGTALRLEAAHEAGSDDESPANSLMLRTVVRW